MIGNNEILHFFVLQFVVFCIISFCLKTLMSQQKAISNKIPAN